MSSACCEFVDIFPWVYVLPFFVFHVRSSPVKDALFILHLFFGVVVVPRFLIYLASCFVLFPLVQSLEELMDEPYFAEYVTGQFCRVTLGQRRGGMESEPVCRITEVMGEQRQVVRTCDLVPVTAHV